MAGRILTLQRQLRELGRIRTGWSEPYTKDGRELRRPVRSETFVLTSAQEEGIRAAAEVWGGEVAKWKPQGAGPEVWRVVTGATAIDAILPPGEPLSQFYELWSGGGCALRCDGETEQKSGKPCVCKAKFGESWFERSAREVCRPTSRLNVFLDLVDFGYWRVESHSFYAAQELAGTVDLIKGLIGPKPAIPIRLRIDQRVKVEGGKSTPYPVIVVEMRGAVASQILAGIAPKLAVTAAAAESAPVEERAALPAAPAAEGAAADWPARFAAATTLDELRAMWATCKAAGAWDDTSKAAWVERGNVLRRTVTATEPPPPVATVELPTEPVVVGAAPPVDDEPDRDTLWAAILQLGYKRHGWQLAEAVAGFEATMRDVTNGRIQTIADADGWALEQYLEMLKAQGGGSS